MADESNTSSNEILEDEQVSYEEETLSEAGSASQSTPSDENASDDDDDDDSTLTPTLSSSYSKLQSSWRKTVRSVKAELRESSHHDSSFINNSNDSSHVSLDGSSQHLLFGGPAEFGGSSHNKVTMDEDANNEFYRKMMTRNNIVTATEYETKEEKNEHDMENGTLQSSLSKLAVEDISELFDMLADPDNEEMERSFRNIISPGHVQANREFYEKLQEKKSLTVDAEGEDDDGSDETEDNDDILKNEATDPKERSSHSADERTQVMVQDWVVVNDRGNPSDCTTSKEEIDTVVFNNVGQNEDNSSAESDVDDQDINDIEGGSDNDDDYGNDIDNNRFIDDEDGSDKEIDDDKNHSSCINDVDGTDNDETDESSHLDENLSASWQASVADEETDLDHSRKSTSLHDSKTTSFRRQMDLMNSGRRNSFHSSSSSASFTKNTRSELREDLEAQVIERVQTNDENIMRELERSFRRLDSDDALEARNEILDVGNGDDGGGDDAKSQLDDDKPPIKTVSRERGRLKKTGDVISSMCCIYLLFAIVCLLAVGVVVLAVFFFQAD